VYGCEYLLTWNCRHIANAEIQRAARLVVRTDGRRGMNSKDEIVEEVRAAREAHAARFNYDLAEMFNDLKAKERARNRNIAALQPVEPQPDTAISG
jgi:hypothetical protein